MASRTPVPGPRDRAARLLRLQADAELSALELHPEGALLLAGNVRGELLVFSTGTGALVARLGAEPASATPKPASPVTAVAWAEIGGQEHVVAGHANGTVRVWHLERGAVVATIAAHRSHVWALALTPASHAGGLAWLLATGGADTHVKLWRLPGAGEGLGATAGMCGSAAPPPRLVKQPLQKLKGHTGEVTCLRFTPDAQLLLSGDTAGGLRVWEVAEGAAGRLAHNLSGHSGAITGIACHPIDCLFASCSADRTIRVWDMDAAPGTCIDVHGPEGRRGVRGLAFTADGRLLLGAYPDGLRTFSLDPLAHQGSADVAWSKVQSVRYTDGKAMAISLFKGDAEVHCIDLTRLQPRSGAAAAVPAGGGGGSGSLSAEPNASGASAQPTLGGSGGTAYLPTTSAFLSTLPAAGVPPPGLAVERGRQALETRGGALNAGPAVEVHAPLQRPARHTAATFTAAPGTRAPADPSTTPPPQPAAAVSRPSQGSEGRGGRLPRVSAEENGGGQGSHSDVAAGACGLELQQGLSMLEVASHGGFLAAALQGSREQCARLRASRALLRDVKGALQRGDALGAVRLLKDGNDLGVTARVLDSGALHRRSPDRFTPELCAAAAPLLRALLAPPACMAHHQAALAVLDAVLERWGDYVRGALSPAPRMAKVDLALEQRQERSRGLRAALLDLAPPLERLAGALNGGRAAQTLARLREL